MAKQTRDSKDPMPTSANSSRVGGGNEPYPSGAEKHGGSKAEHVKADQRFGPKAGPEQPTRQDGGNTPVTGEMHNSKKAERVSESARW